METKTYDVIVVNTHVFNGDETAAEDYRKSDSVRLFLDTPIPGHGPDENGVKVRKDVEQITFSAQAFRFHLFGADSRLQMLVNSNTSIEFLANLLKNAKVKISRTLANKENGEETYNTTIDSITFSDKIDAGIDAAFTAAFTKNLGF